MNSQEFRALQEAYNQVYELDESAIGDRARNAVADQRLDAAQTDTQQSVNKLAKREKVTRASAHIAAKKVEGDVRKSSAYGPQRPKPGTTGAYRITDSFDVYDVILSHLLDEGYADTNEAAITIMVNMSEGWKDNILEARVDDGLSDEEKQDARNKRSGNYTFTRQNLTKAGRGKSPKGLKPSEPTQASMSVAKYTMALNQPRTSVGKRVRGEIEMNKAERGPSGRRGS